MRFVFTVFTALVSTFSLAAGKAHHKHNHDEAKLDIAIQGQTATIELESPAIIIYGFEYEAKKPADIKKRDDGVKTLETKISEIVKFDAKLNCKFTTQKIEPFEKHEKHSNHGEVHASFSVACEKPLAGTKLNFGAKKVFPKMRRIEVQVVGEKQSGAEISDDKGSVDL